MLAVLFLPFGAGVCVAQTPRQESSAPRAQPAILATAVPLPGPAGVAYDSAGNLFVAEAAAQVVVRVTPAGVLSTVAGAGVQGFGGDGGPATAALLDTPVSIAVDAAGDVLIADSHNHRVRRVDSVSGIISTVAAADNPSGVAVAPDGTIFFADRSAQRVFRIDSHLGTAVAVAGSGVEGFSGDGGLALTAALDQPAGLSLDGSNHLYLADSHNGRVRVVDLTTGLIATVPGGANLRLPQGVSSDASGNLLVAERGGNRMLQIVAGAGATTAVAGTGTQGFAGDGGPAVAALLDSPGAVTRSPAGLTVLADTANGRVRAVDAAGVITTVAGLGASPVSTLTLAAPSVVSYGSGSVTATLGASAASGTVSFLEESTPAAPALLGSVALQGNVATLSTSAFAAGSYRIAASYLGDGVHAAAESQTLGLTVAQGQAVAAPMAVSLLYGQPVPVLTGTLTGVLARDAGSVSLGLNSGAGVLSAPGVYPIAASLSGPAAGNYSLATQPAAVTIARAPSAATLNSALAVHVASTISGVPTGVVTLLDGLTALGSAVLDPGGNVSFAGTSLSTGMHTLLASYAGDVDFLPVQSALLSVTVQPVSTADFTLTATGQTAVSVAAGSAAQFGFAVTPVNGALPSQIVLSVSGLPAGAVPSFNPAYLPPSGAPAAFILTVSTPRAALEPGPRGRTPPAWVFALFVPMLFLRRRRLGGLLVLLLGVVLLAGGCGDRINSAGAGTSASSRSYTITVSGTATSSTGATLLHTAAVTLTVQ